MPENLAENNSAHSSISSSSSGGGGTDALNHIASPKKTYADVVSASAPEPKEHSNAELKGQTDEEIYADDDNSHQNIEEDEAAAAENSQNKDEYTTDIYTEDEYTDDYTEDSIFSDSNNSGNSESEQDKIEDTARNYTTTTTTNNHFSFSEPITSRRSPQNIRPWPLIKEDSVSSVAANQHGIFDTNFSSGTTSPNPADALNTTRATEALAPSHRFVSHTPWGTSTGRLTRGQRDKGRLWDDPTMVPDAKLPMFDEQPENSSSSAQRLAVPTTNGTASFVDPAYSAAPRGSSHDSGAQYQEAMHAYTGSLVNGSNDAAHATMYQQQQREQQHIRQLQLQMQQQFKQGQQPNNQQWKFSSQNTHSAATATAAANANANANAAANAAAAASQVVNVVSVQQGTKGYSELQQQMQREQKLHQDTIEGKLLQGKSAPRIVTIAQFIKSVSRLLGTGFPSAGCTEARLTVALVAILGVRTGLDVWFSNFNARCVRAVVTYDRATLLRRLLPEYLGMTLPMAAVNQAIKWVISSLTIALRVRLGRYAHERYVDGITNITWNQLHHQGPNGSTPAYERPDWLLTVQIHRFADMLPRLIADVVKPTIDWFVFSRLLSRVIGRKGSLTMVLYVVLANIVIRLSSPPTGKNASRLAQLEEKYRSVYARISSIIQRAAAASTPLFYQQNQQQQFAERPRDIPSPDPSPHATTPYATDLRPSANGGVNRQQPAFVPRVQAAFRERARNALDSSLDSVASSVVSTNIRRFFGGIGESMLAKYGATLTAYYLLSRPLCSPGRRLASEILHDPAAVMMSYSRNSAYLINLSQATTRLLLMVNDLPKFIWSTVKVDRLLRSLDVHARYRSAVDNMSNEENDNSSYTTDD
ncbi:hypothetical protein LPJ64_003438 [Coemansia asiatica]|uniref:ABC transmembrane type-1 domain-containing protein n=1 Tax=Coemansia asiatica TaxID=1052880 RepID=A0A9W7XK45_9FUNG|nr:hypothetical protein LPJ64_003438 [Coemansia asiatica]